MELKIKSEKIKSDFYKFPIKKFLRHKDTTNFMKLKIRLLNLSKNKRDTPEHGGCQ